MLTRSGLDIVVGRALGTVLMTVRGPLERRSAPDLFQSLDDVLASAPERVVIDLTGVPDLDDDAIGALQQAQSTAESNQVQLQLTTRHPEVRARLSDTPLNIV